MTGVPRGARTDRAWLLVHVLFAAGAFLFLSRAVARLAAGAPDEAVAAGLPPAILLASLLGSLAALIAGRSTWSPARALLLDAATFVGALWLIAVVTLAPWTRDLGGVTVILLAAARLAPGALAAAGGWRPIGPPDAARQRAPAALAFLVALGAYGAAAIWLPAASLPLGDQIHYLLVTERLREGSLDATIDERLFTSILGIPLSPSDTATHVASTPLGPRPIQGYAIPLLLLPGWAIAGRLGAHLTMALVAAWTSYQIFLILRDLATRGVLRGPREEAGAHRPSGASGSGDGPGSVGWTWLTASFLAPLPLLATHIYPNVIGAALIATAFRYGFTAETRRPALAAGLLAATLFLTPRDGLALLVLTPFLLGLVRIGRMDPVARPERVRVAVAAAIVALLSVVVNAGLYGLPVPYAGYAFGTAQAQELTREPSITPRIWIGFPAILFDRTFGLAGSAPWVFIGLLGLVPALRAERARLAGIPAARPILVPAALAVGASVLALSFFRLWEGGYAPPNRYFVAVIPLWVPFVAYGLAVAFAARPHNAWTGRAASWVVRGVVGVALFASALATVVLNAIPTTALNTAFDHRLRDAFGRILGLDPLGWLPSFQPVTPDWYVGAYLRLVPALAIALGLTWRGWHVTRHRMEGRPTELPGVSPSKTAPEVSAFGQSAGLQSFGADVQSFAASPPMPRANISALGGFLGANLLAILLVLIATSQAWIADGSDPVPESLFRKWLPLSLAISAVGAAIVARVLPDLERTALLRRHFAVYLVPLALMLVMHAEGGDVLNGQLGAIYLLIPLIFLANALPALWKVIGALPDRAAALHFAAAALVAFLVLLPYHSAVMPTASDEPHYLLIVQSLLYDGDVDLRNDYEGDRYAAFYPSRLPDMHGIEVGRAVYPIRDLGLPVLSLAPFAVAGRLGVLALMCVVGAALTAQLYLLVRDLRFAPRVAFLAVATTALTHPVLTYTTQVYPELLTALVFVSAVRVLRRGAATRARDLAIASALVALLPWLSTRAWPIAVGLGLVVAYATLRPLWGARGPRWTTVGPGGETPLDTLAPPRPTDRMRPGEVAARLAAGAGPFVAIAAALALANWVMFGLFLPSAGYYLIREQQQVLSYWPHVGLTGLLFDRAFGLIPRAPVYLLAFVGAVALVRRARSGHGAEVYALALGALLSVVYIANIAYWFADGSPPSRYLLGAIPLLVAAVAGGWEIILAATGRLTASPVVGMTLGRTALVALSVATVVLSAAVTYVYAVLPNLRYDLALDIRATGSPGAFFNFVERASGVAAGGAFPSLVTLDALSIVLAAAWTTVGAALVWIGVRTQSGSHPEAA